MPQTFGELLYALIERAGLSVREFAERAGVHQPDISDIRHGHRPAPLKHLDGWAELLGLAGDERERFLDLGAMTHCPDRIRTLVERAEEAAGKSLRELGEEYSG